MSYDVIPTVIQRLREAGHAVEETGILRPDDLLRIDGGPELTQMQFLQIAADLLGETP